MSMMGNGGPSVLQVGAVYKLIECTCFQPLKPEM
jgi:hypothetical protein